MGNKDAIIRKDNHIQFYDNPPNQEDMNHQFLTLLFSNIWHISFRQYTDKQWRNRFQHIKSCTTTELSLKNIDAPEILTKIIHIQFSHLTTLKLNNLCLLSIQPIIHLNAPNLKDLQLSLNHFCNLRSIRKMKAPHLKRFQIYQQAFHSADFFSQCGFDNEMSSIIIFKQGYPIKSAKTKTLPVNYNWMFKIQSKALQQFEYYNTQIIRNTLYNNMARRRYPTAQIKLRYDTL